MIRLLSVNVKRGNHEPSRSVEESLKAPDAERVKKMVEEKSSGVHRKMKATQQRRISRMQDDHIREMNVVTDFVVNTTGATADDVERTLKLGPNFDVEDVRNLPYIEVVANIEKHIQTRENVDEIKSEVSNAIVNHINFHKQPRHACQEWI